MSFRLVPNSVTLNDFERRNKALILCYFAEFSSFRGALRKSGLRCRRKKFTFAVSSPDEMSVFQSHAKLGQQTFCSIWQVFIGQIPFSSLSQQRRNILKE